jgi:hypothetical protein
MIPKGPSKMDNPEKLATLDTRRRQTQQKHNKKKKIYLFLH